MLVERFSYGAHLLAAGLDASLEKIGEEAADLIFHLLVALHQRGVAPDAVLEVLRRRRAGS